MLKSTKFDESLQVATRPFDQLQASTTINNNNVPMLKTRAHAEVSDGGALHGGEFVRRLSERGCYRLMDEPGASVMH